MDKTGVLHYGQQWYITLWTTLVYNIMDSTGI